MSLNLNKVILAGRMTADPELKQTQNGISMVTFSIAVNRRFGGRGDGQQNQPEADFFRVIAWRNTADFVSKFFRKGSAICVIGSIQNRNWTDQQGQKHYVTEILADEANFVESRSAAESGGNGYGYSAPAQDPYAAPAYSSPAASAPKFEEIKTDDDLPF